MLQGETEATAVNGPTQASQYGATFTTFLAALRQDLAGLYEDRYGT